MHTPEHSEPLAALLGRLHQAHDQLRDDTLASVAALAAQLQRPDSPSSWNVPPLPPGQSPAWRNFLAELDAAANTNQPVLIQGEIGSGTGRAARALHDRSPRRAQPFVLWHPAIDGAAIGTGTLGIRQVDRLTAGEQTVLLDAFHRHHGCRWRWVATAHDELAVSVVRGQFPSALFYRLAGQVIRVPPLRECRDDLPLWVRSILERLGTPKLSLSTGTLARLRSYPWPGNMRELETMIERAVRAVELREGELDLPAGWFEPPEVVIPDEPRRILAALTSCDGHLGRTAELLGMPRSTLYGRMRRYGMRTPNQPDR
jgi:DNA-binding NtrC family response regulator